MTALEAELSRRRAAAEGGGHGGGHGGGGGGGGGGDAGVKTKLMEARAENERLKAQVAALQRR